MSSALMPAPSLALPSLPSRALLRNAAAAMVAVGLHGVVLGLLLSQWPSDTPEPPQVRTLTTRLISLAPPAPPPPEVVVPPAPALPLEPVKPPEAPKSDPRLQQQKLEQAALARKRVQEQKREQLRLEQQRHERQRIEQQRLEQQRQEAELRQQQEQLRQAELQAQAAERARQAEAAAAASRQYLPIAKDAPDYPERALDKGIEGDCTVSYRVNPQGRVENPQVVGDCHPLFVRPSLTAARTFRYQPRMVDGQAVAVEGVKNTFHYRIE